MPDFGFDGVSSSLAEVMSIFLVFNVFFQLSFRIMYVTQTPHELCRVRAKPTVATTLYTPAPCQQSR